MITASVPLEADFTLAAQTAFIRLDDGSGRLLNLSGNFYALTPTAAWMLGEILRYGPALTAQRMGDVYGLTPDRARADLAAFLESLQRQKLIQRHDSAFKPAEPQPSAWLGGILRLMNVLARSLPWRGWLLLALAYGAIHWLGWPRTLATFRDVYEAAGRSTGGKDSINAIEAAVRSLAAGHPLPVQCMERSLVCWSLLKAAGRAARLIIGVDFYPFASHCWCELDGRVIADFADRCEVYRPVFVYE